MTQGSGEEITLAQLGKKLEDQSRFTRVVSVVCTLAILGVMYYTMTSEFAYLPDLVLARMMGNMESMVNEVNLIQAAAAKKKAGAAAAAATPSK
jgi:hypothetical protein